jgi:hypothetical protein
MNRVHHEPPLMSEPRPPRKLLGGFLCSSLLTIPANLASAQETIQHLQSHGFPKPEMFVNTPVACPTHINQVHQNIFEGHWEMVKNFYLGPFRARRDLHLLLLEDDVRVLHRDAARIIVEKVRLLDKLWPNWSVLFLGCASLGPAVPVGSGFVIASAPYSVHAYVINGRKTGTICQMSKSICRRPLFPEGCSVFPLTERFALFWPLVTQIRVPKEFLFKHVPILRDWITYDRTLVALMWISCFGPALLMFVVVMMLVRVTRRALNDTAENERLSKATNARGRLKR